jgi:hypothetical protein
MAEVDGAHTHNDGATELGISPSAVITAAANDAAVLAIAAKLAKESVDRTNKTMLKMVAAVCLVVVLSVGGAMGWTVREVSLIRDTQVTNTNRSNCQDKAFDIIATDVHSIFTHVQKASAYALPSPKCP